MYKVILVIDDACEVVHIDWEAEDGSSAATRNLLATAVQAKEDDDKDILDAIDFEIGKQGDSYTLTDDEMFGEMLDVANQDLPRACPQKAGVYFMRCKFVHSGPDRDGEYDSECQVIGEVSDLCNFDCVLGRYEIEGLR